MREMIDVGRVADYKINTRRSLSCGLLMTLCDGSERHFLPITKSIRRLDIRPVLILLRQRFIGAVQHILCHHHQPLCSQHMPEITLGKILFYPLLVVSNLQTLLSVRLPQISLADLPADLLSLRCLLSLLELFSPSDFLRIPHGFTFRDQRFTPSDPLRSLKPYSRIHPETHSQSIRQPSPPDNFALASRPKNQ